MIEKKVCIMTSVHPVFDTRIFYKQCKSLAEKGFEVILIAKHHREEVVDGIRIVPFPEFKNRFLRILFSPVKMFFLAIRQKTYIYHFHDPELIPSGILLKCFWKKVIYDTHEDYKKAMLSSYYLPRYIRQAVGWSVNFIEQISSLFFDVIISATDDISKNFQNHKRSVVVANYPLLSSINAIKKKPKRKKSKNTFKVIYAGSLAPERGLIQIIQAMQIIKDFEKIRLVLCGTFSPHSFEKEIRNTKGFEQVDYYGFVDYRVLYEYYVQADVGVVNFLPDPNHINAMPNKLFEYMAAGLPVIASNFPLWKEIVERNQCGITIDPLNPEDIAKAIVYFFKNTKLKEKMGENGRQSVIENYNWDRENAKLLQVYAALLK